MYPGIEKVRNAFAKHFSSNRSPVVALAPGRINLIGEHTDYNDGFVLPMTINRAVCVALAARDDDQCRLHSINFDETAAFSLSEISRGQSRHWAEYPKGVIDQLLKRRDALQGIDAVVWGDVPIGSGLSSSAAIETAFALALRSAFGIPLNDRELVQFCQKAENEFVGVQCGIMDQFVSCLGRQARALFLDCRSLEYELVPARPEHASFVIIDTAVRRTLAGSAYNRRREECQEGVRILGEAVTGIRALRDVTGEHLKQFSTLFEENVRKRAVHVVEENDRVVRSVPLMRAGNWGEFGKLLYESHRSLKDLYEVSCAELDFIVEIAEGTGILGARLTGAGFGGCAIALVQDAKLDEFGNELMKRYHEKFGIDPVIIPVRTGLEATVVSSEGV